MTRLIKLQVTRSCVKLLVLDHHGFRVAQVTEDVVVQEKATLVYSLLFLALTAHA